MTLFCKHLLVGFNYLKPEKASYIREMVVVCGVAGFVSPLTNSQICVEWHIFVAGGLEGGVKIFLGAFGTSEMRSHSRYIVRTNTSRIIVRTFKILC